MQPVIKIAKHRKRKLKLLGPKTAQLGLAQRASSPGGAVAQRERPSHGGHRPAQAWGRHTAQRGPTVHRHAAQARHQPAQAGRHRTSPARRSGPADMRPRRTDADGPAMPAHAARTDSGGILVIRPLSFL